MPPEAVRRRTQGSNPNPQVFLNIGRRCRDDMRAALRAVGLDWSHFRSVLDFGCGCGRTLAWMDGESPDWTLHGTDVEIRRPSLGARSTCRLPGAASMTDCPRWDYTDQAFDLVYAIAVFTHLDRARELAWLDELARVTRPRAAPCC